MIGILSAATGLVLLIVLLIILARRVKTRQSHDARRETVAESSTQEILVQAKEDLIIQSHSLCQELELFRDGRR